MALNLNDLTVNGNNLTNVGAAEVAGLFAGSSTAADFELSESDYMTLVTSATLKPTGNFTIEAVIKPESIGANQFIFASWSNESSIFSGILFDIQTNGTLRIVSSKNTGQVQGTDYQFHTSTTVLVAGTQYHIAGVYDGSKLRLYIDGTEEGTGTAWANAPVYAASTYQRLGTVSDTGASNVLYFDGVIDEVRLWGVARTQAQIDANKAIEIDQNTANLNAYWSFESLSISPFPSHFQV